MNEEKNYISRSKRLAIISLPALIWLHPGTIFDLGRNVRGWSGEGRAMITGCLNKVTCTILKIKIQTPPDKY